MIMKIIKAPNRAGIQEHAIFVFNTVTRYCSNHYNSPSYGIYDTKKLLRNYKVETDRLYYEPRNR